MKISELIRIANRNLFRAKLRTFLTVMAIFVGSFTLTLTNGLSDGLRDYIENQVKNLEGNNILFVRKKLPSEESQNAKPDAPREYKEATEDDAGNMIDPNSFSVSLAQMEGITGKMPEVKTVTPQYLVDGEYITLDGDKKYQVALGMLSEGIVQKTEAGKTIDGAGQIMLPLSLAKTFNENINQLIGKTATVAYKAGQNGEIKTVQLKIVGVSTKGFMANFNSFVDVPTARKIYDEQQSQSPEYNKFTNFTLQLNSGDEAQITAVKKKLDEQGFSGETFADRKSGLMTASASFKSG